MESSNYLTWDGKSMGQHLCVADAVALRLHHGGAPACPRWRAVLHVQGSQDVTLGAQERHSFTLIRTGAHTGSLSQIAHGSEGKTLDCVLNLKHGAGWQGHYERTQPKGKK